MVTLDSERLDESLQELGVDGYLIDAASDESDQYYLSGFDAPDPYFTLYTGEVHLLFSRSLEFARAKKESRAATVERYVDYDYQEHADAHGREEARRRVLAGFLDAYDVDSVAVPPRFPIRTGDDLRAKDVDVKPDERGLITDLRAIKTDEEIDYVREAQRANEAAMHHAEDLLASASVDDEGRLVAGGDVLTSERVKEEIEVALLRAGCSLNETIVACGTDAADPHDRGSGPLRADEPIIVDIFPQDKTTRYHADMTRTFVKGTPDETVREWYDLTEEAKQAGLDAVAPGVTGEAVHDAVCDVYEEAGIPTLREDERSETGFIHSTGHGVGLDVHEQPRVGPEGGELEPGHVITVEPGIYDPAHGGVRIEDLVVVTEDGCENLTDYSQTLTL
jgi:Xaa-Pro aminopeptidase